MDRLKLTEHFYIDEFLDIETYNAWVHDFKKWKYYDSLLKVANIAEFIREKVGKAVTINDWGLGGQFQFSGFRGTLCKIGSPASEHRKMNALDVKCSGFYGEEWELFVVHNKADLMQLGVSRVEHKSIAKTWLHLDCKEPQLADEIKCIDLTKVVYTL